MMCVAGTVATHLARVTNVPGKVTPWYRRDSGEMSGRSFDVDRWSVHSGTCQLCEVWDLRRWPTKRVGPDADGRVCAGDANCATIVKRWMKWSLS